MKRYVLTKDKEIRLSNKYDDLNANVDKSSDNLIDLLEVGDCVECDYGLYNETYSVNNERQLNDFKGDNTVVAIWKHNGDIMRRYER